jgi:Ca-activated chloride channel family protein
MYIYFSSKGSNYTKSSDTLESQFYFELNKNAVVNDSWLWVEDTLVKAKLIDRWTANQIYEGIVKRTRSDPSIFFKNSATQYEFRVYPLPGDKTRKVKISWLEPGFWNASTVDFQIPIKIFNTSKIPPKVKFVLLTNDNFKDPATDLNTEFTFVQDDIYGATYQADLNSFSSYGNNNLYFKYKNPMKDGVFVSTYKDSFEEGYFQLAFLPSLAVDVEDSKKVIFAIDYDVTGVSMSIENMITSVKNIALKYLTPKDSFNIIISSFAPELLFQGWTVATKEGIEGKFNQLNGSEFSNFNYLPYILQKAIDYTDQKTDGNVNLLVISSSYQYGALETANKMISSLTSNNKKLPRMYFVNFATNLPSNYMGGIYYYGNQYLYYHLAKLTKGEMVVFKQDFNTSLNQGMEKMSLKLLGYDFNTSLSDGFCYGQYYLQNFNTNATLSSPIVLTGKYIGEKDFKVSFSGFYKADKTHTFNSDIMLSEYNTYDELTYKMWLSQYILNLEMISNPANSIVAEIVETSMKNRLLSIYTAFLALEPWMMQDDPGNDTDPEDPNEGGGTTVFMVNDLDIIFEANPNPFTNYINISLDMSSMMSNEIISMDVYDISGTNVYTFDISNVANGKVNVNWNGVNKYGEQLANGIYLVVVKTKNFTKTLKVVIQK